MPPGQQPDGTVPATFYLPYLIAQEAVLAPVLRYGATTPVGEGLEACATEATANNAVVLTPTDDWENRITEATPGTTLLLRGGVYQARDKIWLPAGQPDQWITLKPYNCEAVTIYTSLRPASYNVIAGLHIEARGIGDISWVIRLDGKNKGALRYIEIRNNTLLGGDRDALKVSADVAHVVISGNHIDGGKAAHVLNVQSEGEANAPDQILITNNLLNKSYFSTPSEDMIQITDALNVEFSFNSCTNGHRMEQCVDIKHTRAPVLIHNNLFDGATLHLDGDGVDQSKGCMTIHENDGHPENHLIEQNLFRHCRDTIIRFASEGGAMLASGTLHHNVFVNPSATDADGLLIWAARDVTFVNNTMIRGTFKLGAADDSSKIPQNTLWKNNIFYLSRIDDRTQPPATNHICAYNLFFQTTGAFNPARCQNNHWNVDPLLQDVAQENFRPADHSPACGAGENNVDLGALPCG